MPLPVIAAAYPFRDTALSIDERVSDLVSRLSCAEKMAQTGNMAPGIPRLGVNPYAYWNEACHGLVANGATVFPQAIALSATWDTTLVHTIAGAISDEARAFANSRGSALNFWAPTINMARDPRWGRNEETYGEDVFLTKKMAVNYIKGMQGDNPRYLKTIATVKHFACNNVELNCIGASSDVDERSLREYYFPAFEAAVIDAHVGAVMSAYNALNGIPCSGNRLLLTDILRNEWGFKGYVVSDCDAIQYMNTAHHYVATNAQAAVVGCQAGCDLNCGETYQNYFPIALQTALWSFSEKFLDTAVKRILRSRFLLGEFDPPGCVPYAAIPASVVYNSQHRDLSLAAACKAIVLLKNNGILPLDTTGMRAVAVIGPNADQCVLGGYSAAAVSTISPLGGIIDKIGGPQGKKVDFVKGCSVSGPLDQGEFNRATAAAASADVAIMVMGTDNSLISEGHDQQSLRLPGVQEELVKAVYAVNSRTIVVLVNGNPLAVGWLEDHVPAIVETWYDGPFQGKAIADALMGDYCPGGKLTQTWVRGDSALPPMNDYAVFKNRTYMYYKGQPLYPFGFGLSYTTFEYGALTVNPSRIGPGDTAHVTATVTNSGSRAGDEVAQLYVHSAGSDSSSAPQLLKGFCRISLQAHETKKSTFDIPYEEFSSWDLRTHSLAVGGADFDIMVGGSSRSIALTESISTTARHHDMPDWEAASEPHELRVGTGNYRLRIGRGNFRMEILKPDGRVIYSVAARGPKTVTLGALPPGVYVVRITGEGKQWLGKRIVPR